MKVIAKKAHVLFGAALLATITLASCGGFFDDASAADSALPAPATTTATTTKPKPAENSEPTYYTITIDKNIENGNVVASAKSATPASKAVEGETVTLAASPAEGYALTTLTYTPQGGEATVVEGSGDTRTFKMPAANVTVHATFTPIAYSVTVTECVGEGSVGLLTSNANEGQRISLVPILNDGWRLDSWNVKDKDGNSITVTDNSFEMPNSDVSVSAVFVKIDYSITILDAENGGVSTENASANYGDTVTLTITPDEGYALATLTYTTRSEPPVDIGGSGGARTFTMPLGDVTVQAAFTPIAYSVVVAQSVTGGRIAASPTNADMNQEISLTAVADTGWKLKAWNVVAEGGAPVTVTNNKFRMPAKNVSVSATFEKINYTVTVLQSANGTLSADKTTANYGEPVTLTARPADGYALETLAYTPQGGSPEYIEGSGDTRTLSMPAANVTVSATFTPMALSVNVADSITGGRIAASSTNANVGDVITLVPTANTGWQFKAWNVVAEGGATVAVTENQFTMPAKSVSVSATFEKINYSITVEEAENGSVRADKTTANYGDTVTIDLAAKDGYEFETVSVKDSDGHEVGTSALLDGEKYKFTMPASNVTVTATFAAMEPLKVPLTLEAVEAGAKVTFKNMAAGPVTYKVNGGAAQTIASETTATITLGAAGDKVAFYGDNATYTKDYRTRSNISCDKNCYVYGNIMSLVKSIEFASAVELKGGDTFRELFYDNRCITNKPSAELLLPATTLANRCYYEMFRDCRSLTTAPELPATTLADRCYFHMFYGCKSLTSTPELPATTLTYLCYYGMFGCCESLTSAPVLPATTLAESCYSGMFSGCTNLTSAPELPATTLAESCYSGMFSGCTNLTSAPELPATTLVSACYSGLFSRCTGLTSAPELPATTLAESCYASMFRGCTNLTSAPELPATTLAGKCYESMFSGCTGLTVVPVLPVTVLEKECYESMFSDCTSLTSAPALPATTLANKCYYHMFKGCTNLTSAPELPATTLVESCYDNMFGECTSLEIAPVLPAATLAGWCYTWMFKNCANLNSVTCLATDISAENCTKDWLSGVASSGTFTKADGIAVGETGWQTNSISGIPSGWTVKDEGWQYPHSITIADNIAHGTVTADKAAANYGDTVTLTVKPATSYKLDALTVKAASGAAIATSGNDDKITFTMPASNVTVEATFDATSSDMLKVPLTLEAIEAGVVVTFENQAAGPVTYKVNGGEKQTIAKYTTATITLGAVGDKVAFYGDNKTYTNPSGYTYPSSIQCDKKCYIYGNIMSLVKSEDFENAVELKSDYTFSLLFEENSCITNKPDAELLLPATTLASACYLGMFYGCTNLTSAPALPATTLADGCYCDMFSGCTNLTSAPALPATTLADECYIRMFKGCTNLTSAPALPATTLAWKCYRGMFSGCARLTSAPALPATTLAGRCYREMFSGCARLTSAPALPATTLASSCYESMFRGCTNLTSAPALPATTLAEPADDYDGDYDGGCYQNMFYGCTRLTSAPALPATTLAASCYYGMFSGCDSLTSAPALPATTLASSCYESMFRGCDSLTSAPELPATTLAESCYAGMFYNCSRLKSAPDLPAAMLTKGCYYEMFYGCRSLNSVTCLATDIGAENCTKVWLSGVASSGTFTKAPGIAVGETGGWQTNSASGIPKGWTVKDYEP